MYFLLKINEEISFTKRDKMKDKLYFKKRRVI